jgi:hypothetical protein
MTTLAIIPTINKSYEMIGGKYEQVSTTLFMVYAETNGQRELLVKNLYKTQEEATRIGNTLLEGRNRIAQPTPKATSAPVTKGHKCPRCGATDRDANFSTCPPYCDDCA